MSDTVKQQLLDLYSIQRIDQSIFEIEKQDGDLPKTIRTFGKDIEVLRSALETQEEQRRVLENDIAQLEEASLSEGEKAKTWERRLQDIRNQREFLALSREVDGAKRAQRRNEEQVLELLNQREELQTEIDRSRQALTDKSKALQDAEAELEARRSDIESSVAAYKEQRTKIAPKIKTNLLTRYDRIRARRQQQGLAVANDGKCQACNMRLPPQLYNVLMRANTVEQCPSCQRILVYKDLVTFDEEVQGPNVVAPR